MKMWSGRFTKQSSELSDSFNTSLPFDSRMYKEDIAGSIAHATMLGETGIISKNESLIIIDGLESILDDLVNGILDFSNGGEDIHMFIEAELTQRIGDIGKKLHTARSRNDQVTTDTKLYVLNQIKSIKEKLKDIVQLFVNIAKENLNSYMPGFTHMQKAQPITLAHYLCAYVEMFLRDIDRLNDNHKRTNILPLGSGALAGTTHPIDRKMVATLLEMDDVNYNSLDGVSDRDYVAELMFSISMIMIHLSRFCEELITFASDEYRFVEIDDAYSTGSSIMPQKKNPDMAELIRGKSGRCIGNLMSILTILKGLPLAYNKDMQEDKEGLFDSIDTVNSCLDIFFPMIDTLKFNTEKMEQSAKSGYTNATDIADYLVRKGIPFRSAHEISGKLTLLAIDKHCYLEDLLLDEYKEYCNVFESDIYDAININTVVGKRMSIGGCSPDSVLESIKVYEEKLLTL